MSIDNIISAATAEALKSLYGLEVEASTIVPQTTKKEFEGNLTIVVFPFLKASHKAPDATAKEIGDYLVANCETVKEYNVIKGFLNITVEPKFWLGVLDHIHATKDYGFKTADDNSELVMIEYSSPNTNKPLHLGHVRNNLLGYSLSRIMQANGYKGENKYRERPRHPYLQIDARMAEVGQRRYSGIDRQEGRPPYR